MPGDALLEHRRFRADAVFASGLQRGDEPSAAQVRRAVAAVIDAFGEAFADSASEAGPRSDAGALLVADFRLPAEQASGRQEAMT